MFNTSASRGGRRYHYPPLTNGEAVYVIGDIHGRADLLDALHAEIDAAGDARQALEIYLGDYVDRGPDSAGVIERLVRRGRQRDLVLLRGNHEALFQQAMAGTLELREWARFGGLQTLRSYGIEPADWRDGAHWVARLRERVPAEHATFLRGLLDSAWRGDYFFAHAGVRPGVPLGAQTSNDLCWIRREFLDDDRDHGAVVVHGHTLTEKPELRRNRINLDTGAYLSGRLTCLRIDHEGARLFGGAAGPSAPILAPASDAVAFSRSRSPARPPGPSGEESRIARARRAGAAMLFGWRARKPAASPAEGR